jgi:hypothetical protein
MKIIESNNIQVETKKYTLTFDKKRLLATFKLKNEDFYYGMCLLSAVDKVGQTDKSFGIKDIRIASSNRYNTVICIEEQSSIWQKKQHVYRCHDDYFEYYTIVKGRGNIDHCYYFRGVRDGAELGSLPGFTTVVAGCPNFLGKKYFHISERVSIGLDPDPEVWGPALSSGPFCFALNNDFKGSWVTMGIAAKSGRNTFQKFEFGYKPDNVRQTHDSVVNTQSFSLAYYGKEKVEDTWESPHLVCQKSTALYKGIADYVQWLYKNNYLVKNRNRIYSWWKRPIFCGWHEQVCYGRKTVKDNSRIAMESGMHAKMCCTRKNYEHWLSTLEKNKIDIGTIIIDANWQDSEGIYAADPIKWPDLRGFIDKQHKCGRKVMLWMQAWTRQGLPPRECMAIDSKPIAFDPTNPAFIKRFKDGLYKMLSDGPLCYNADGLKIDGTNVQPMAYDLKNYKNVFGHELFRALLELVHTESKKIKKDALISVFTANPYFRDVCDMVRLGDLYTAEGDPRSTMMHRAEIIRAAMPNILIDTDGAFRFDMRNEYLDTFDLQCTLGIPTLYQSKDVVHCRTFSVAVEHNFTAKEYATMARKIRDEKQIYYTPFRRRLSK